MGCSTAGRRLGPNAPVTPWPGVPWVQTLVNLLAVYRDRTGRTDAETHLVPVDRYHHDVDVPVDNDLFTNTSCEYQHDLASLSRFGSVP